MSDVGQRDSDRRNNVLELLRKRKRQALFVHELCATLRQAHGASISDIERALAELEADGAVVVRDHYCADPHLEGVDLRVVALVEPSAGEDALLQSIRASEDTWNDWLAMYLANHRCGSTIVVNAILERRGAKTALVTTQGFRDVYEIGRINRPESFNLRFHKHRPLVSREFVFEVPERMRADGTEFTPLDEDAARQVAQILQAEGITAVAVVFLHSYRAPEHEIRMGEILGATDANLFITASHELSREYREYERTSTTVANAYVGPIVSTYLGDLEQRLAQRGFRGSLMIMQSNGGLQDVVTAGRQCIQVNYPAVNGGACRWLRQPAARAAGEGEPQP